MLRHRLRLLVVLTATLAVGLLGTLAAPQASAQVADPDCGLRSHTLPDGTEVWVWTCSADWSGGGGGGGWTCQILHQGRPMQVPCVDPVLGWFTTMHGGCYIKPRTPQPPASDPVWGGHDPSEGVIYLASCFALDSVDGMPYVQLPTSIFLSALDGPIGDLIEQAIALLPLRAPDIHIAPDPSGVGLVGLPVWMWTPEEHWGPFSASLSALGVTVNVQAEPGQIRWRMGDGGERVCRAPGTPYHPGYGGEGSPDCGYTYTQPSRTQPDGRYHITATTEWRIDWEIAGTTIGGTETRNRESTTTVRINELQVVTS